MRLMFTLLTLVSLIVPTARAQSYHYIQSWHGKPDPNVPVYSTPVVTESPVMVTSHSTAPGATVTSPVESSCAAPSCGECVPECAKRRLLSGWHPDLLARLGSWKMASSHSTTCVECVPCGDQWKHLSSSQPGLFSRIGGWCGFSGSATACPATCCEPVKHTKVACPAPVCATPVKVKATCPAPTCAKASPECPKRRVTGCHSGVLARLGGWFCYHDTGCCKEKPTCLSPCSTPLYVYFFRGCAYRPGTCGECSHGNAEGAVNPSYSRSVLPVGHTLGALPTGIAGSCCR